MQQSDSLCTADKWIKQIIALHIDVRNLSYLIPLYLFDRYGPFPSEPPISVSVQLVCLFQSLNGRLPRMDIWYHKQPLYQK